MAYNVTLQNVGTAFQGVSEKLIQVTAMAALAYMEGRDGIGTKDGQKLPVAQIGDDIRKVLQAGGNKRSSCYQISAVALAVAREVFKMGVEARKPIYENDHDTAVSLVLGFMRQKWDCSTFSALEAEIMPNKKGNGGSRTFAEKANAFFKSATREEVPSVEEMNALAGAMIEHLPPEHRAALVQALTKAAAPKADDATKATEAADKEAAKAPARRKAPAKKTA